MTILKEYFRTLHQKKLFRVLTTAGVFIGMPFIGIYSYFWGVKRVQLDHVPIKLLDPKSRLKGLKIAQISDLHYGPSNKDENYFTLAINIIHSQKPDLIVLTGDYYQWDPNFIDGLPQILSQLQAPLGVYGIFGNHDYGACYPGKLRCDPFDHNELREKFGRNGIPILCNESLQMTYKGAPFNLVGLHDLWSGMFDPAEAFHGVDEKLPTVVLSHNPDTIELVDKDFDLMLSGHVHGGQVSFPLIGPLAVPIKYRHRRRGLHKISERKSLYVNRGLGYNFRLRINSPPEVTLIEFV